MKIVILFGTESGTSEFVANDLADAIADFDDSIEVEVGDMADRFVGDIDIDALHLIICATYGEGDLPASAKPFYAELQGERPDLTGLRYAMFGLGDSSYEDTYSQGSEIIDAIFTELGATRVGEYGRHDATGRDDATGVALTWLEGLQKTVLTADATA